MSIAMRPEDAKAWFGASSPDLSVEARARGKDWLYTYLRSFYRDPTRPTGWNNRVFENVGMPHVLWTLQGIRDAKFEMEADEKTGEKARRFVGYTQVTPGVMSNVDYDFIMGIWSRTFRGCRNPRSSSESRSASGFWCSWSC